MRKQFAVAATLLLSASLPWPASAGTFSFNFSGPGVSGAVQLTYGTATDATYSQAFEVTGISGTFSDSNDGLNIVDQPISSLVPINYATPESTNLLAPADFSKFSVATGLQATNAGSLTYDNLFYPDGAPPTASDYTASGGFLDIYGLLFNIAGGDVVNIWSNGTFGDTPITYGLAVVTPATALDYEYDGVTMTPEPGAFGLLGSGLLGVVVWCRRALRQRLL